MRLKGYRCFDYIYKEGSRFHSHSMVLRITTGDPKLQSKVKNLNRKCSIKCAISISNKVSKKSIIRNRLRRLFHQHLTIRLSNIDISREIWAFISLKPSCMERPPNTLLKECDKLLLKAGLIKWLVPMKTFFTKAVLQAETW